MLENVSEGKYEFYFQGMEDDGGEERSSRSSRSSRSRQQPRRSRSRDRRDEVEVGVEEEEKVRNVTAIAWDREKYSGSPLQLGDQRLREWSKWLREHDLTVVRLVSIGTSQSTVGSA